jgi:hypothetical protein
MPPPFTDQFWRALADYGVNLPALGAANTTWLTEYTRVRNTALASVLLTASGTEGGNASGSRQFPQEILLDALHCRRFEFDPAYLLPPHLSAFPSAKIERSRPAASRNRT